MYRDVVETSTVDHDVKSLKPRYYSDWHFLRSCWQASTLAKNLQKCKYVEEIYILCFKSPPCQRERSSHNKTNEGWNVPVLERYLSHRANILFQQKSVFVVYDFVFLKSRLLLCTGLDMEYFLLHI